MTLRAIGLIELVVMVLTVSMIMVWAGILINMQHPHTVNFSQRWAPALKLAPAIVFPPKQLRKEISWPCDRRCKATV